MASKRNKKYTMRAISPKFSEKGGFTAQFTGDGYSIDAFGEILPDVIERNGIKVSEGVAKDLISKFLQACANKTAATGEMVTVDGKYLQLLDGDYVTAKCGDDERELEVVESAEDEQGTVPHGHGHRHPRHSRHDLDQGRRRQLRRRLQHPHPDHPRLRDGAVVPPTTWQARHFQTRKLGRAASPRRPQSRATASSFTCHCGPLIERALP